MKAKKKTVGFLPQLDIAAGIDVHKDKMVLCIIKATGETEFSEFGTTTRQLNKIKDYLLSHSVKDCIMESTGTYWCSLYAILEQAGMRIVLGNPYKIKQMPREKTDKKDSQWLGRLLLNNMVKPSFVPPKDQRDLRDYTRMRLIYSHQCTRIKNRMVKILETNNVKLRSVVSNLRTKTAIAIIRSLSLGETDPQKLKELCKGKLRKKMELMPEALEGTIGLHEQIMLKMLVKELDFYNELIDQLDQQIDELVIPYAKESEKLQQIKGIAEKSAEVIISEIGTDMSKFPSPDHLTAFGGLAPGQKETGGKRKPVSIRRGNKYLTTAMIQVAWVAVRMKDSYWQAIYKNLIRKLPKGKAIVAIARKLLKIVYKILNEDFIYEELTGQDYWNRVWARRTLLNRS
jgi:transposase